MDNNQHQDIKARAYEIWEAEGRPHGRDQAHWQQAEQDVLANQDAPASEDNAGSASETPDEGADKTDVMAAASSPAPAMLPPKSEKRKSTGRKASTTH
ncbi:MAG: DUF2934 domain-containing protein [Alphaproteobacteria bacterium]|nr:DUF2934 domain-containing protein [Alphaproteobacteria bacterium]MBU0793301.1 DUF2934 domain-containing protein [Alphaproteobacteria bacterium]MBU0876372.1 DUF2934 domain-containing protein [Alphaproteobacteria bacterium]MBU1770971.1 DUF2934 domain-containing protein [Alphaproteobacteria bacterium]